MFKKYNVIVVGGNHFKDVVSRKTFIEYVKNKYQQGKYISMNFEAVWKWNELNLVSVIEIKCFRELQICLVNGKLWNYFINEYLSEMLKDTGLYNDNILRCQLPEITNSKS